MNTANMVLTDDELGLISYLARDYIRHKRDILGVLKKKPIVNDADLGKMHRLEKSIRLADRVITKVNNAGN